MSCNVCLTLLAITVDASLYNTFKSDIGRQFFKLYLDLFGVGKHVINPCFCVTLKDPISTQKTWKTLLYNHLNQDSYYYHILRAFAISV